MTHNRQTRAAQVASTSNKGEHMEQINEAALRELAKSDDDIKLAPDVLTDLLDTIASQRQVIAGQGKREFTDAEAHALLVEMNDHLMKWSDLNDFEDDNHPTFAGECVRFLQSRLAALVAPHQESAA